jgi:hypothetical protein
MARIRTIKPEYWTDEKVVECSPTARLLFIGLWNFADDYGNLERSSKQIKFRILPADAIDVEPLVQELIQVGLVWEYEVDGCKYLHIKGFAKHQKIEKRSKPRFPLPDFSGSPRGVVGEPSPTTRGVLGEPSEKMALDQGRDQGREGIKDQGRDQGENLSWSSPGDDDRVISVIEGKKSTPRRRKPVDYPDGFEQFWSLYPRRLHKQTALRAYRAASKRPGFSLDDLLTATRHYALERDGQDERFTKHPATFLNDDRWRDHISSPEKRVANDIPRDCIGRPLVAQ